MILVAVIINPLLHRLFLDHDIIFYFLTILKKKIQEKFKYNFDTFENIIENGAFAPRSKCSIFHNTFKYIVFQRRQKALLLS